MKPRRGEKKTDRRVSVSPSRRLPIITLLTDFGNADYFVVSVKGVILSANPEARIVDLTHEIAAHDIQAAAFTLLASYKSFPAGTIHVAVVDPGVGSARRGICVAAGEQFFVGPDNGIFSYIYERESKFRVYELSNAEFFQEPVSATFHCRDIFAPVAAALSRGLRPAKLGRQANDPVRLASLTLELQDSRLLARIIHIDRFGNCVTNLTPESLNEEMIDAGAHLVVKGKKITSFRNFFAENSGSRAELFGVWGSAGFLEIAANNRSAAKLLKATRGDLVVIEINVPAGDKVNSRGQRPRFRNK